MLPTNVCRRMYQQLGATPEVFKYPALVLAHCPVSEREEVSSGPNPERVNGRKG